MQINLVAGYVLKEGQEPWFIGVAPETVMRSIIEEIKTEDPNITIDVHPATKEEREKEIRQYDEGVTFETLYPRYFHPTSYLRVVR